MKRWLVAAKRHRARVVGGGGVAPDTTVNAGQSTFTSDDYDILANSTDTATLTITARNAAGTALADKTATISRETIAVSAANSVVDVSPSAIDDDGVDAATVTLTLRDGSNRPIPNIPASDCVLAVSGSGNTVTQPTGSTNQAGQISGSFVSTVAATKVCSFTVRSTAITDTASCVVGTGGGGFPIPTVNEFYNSTEFEMSGSAPVNTAIKFMEDFSTGWWYKANVEGYLLGSSGTRLFTGTVSDAGNLQYTKGWAGQIFSVDAIPVDSTGWTALGQTGILVADATAWGSGALYGATYGELAGGATNYSNFMADHNLAPSGVGGGGYEHVCIRWRRWFPSNYDFGAEKVMTINPPDWSGDAGIIWGNVHINLGAGSSSTTGALAWQGVNEGGGSVSYTGLATLQRNHVYDFCLEIDLNGLGSGVGVLKMWCTDLGTPSAFSVPASATQVLNRTDYTWIAANGTSTQVGNIWPESWANPVSGSDAPGSMHTNYVVMADTAGPILGRGA